MKSSIILDFNDEFFSGVPRNLGPLHGTEPVVKKYPTVHINDLEPVNIICPDMRNGPWIAGGAALKWWQNQQVGESDIDVFCRDNFQVDEVLSRIYSYGRWTEKYNSDNAVTVEYWPKEMSTNRWTIQIIKRRYFKNLQEVLNSFDISVCEIGTCGHRWLLGEHTAKDIRQRNLRFKMPLQPDSVKRLTKYWVYGYRPIEGTIDNIINNSAIKWNFSVDEEYQNAF